MLKTDVTATEIAGRSQDLYLDLMKKCLTFWLWDAKDGSANYGPPRNVAKRILKGLQTRRMATPSTTDLRRDGRDWPVLAHTMIGLKRLENLQFCVEDCLRNDIPGNLIETGVWRGGASIFMRAILKAYGVADRRVWVADSFAGLPSPNESKYPADVNDISHTYKPLAVSERAGTSSWTTSVPSPDVDERWKTFEHDGKRGVSCCFVRRRAHSNR